METIQDFEDIPSFLNEHEARYLIVGGLAFIYHAKPRYTKDIDIWIGLDDLIRVKESIDHPRHQEDVRVLRQVKKLRGEPGQSV